jgi:hypothetical protein
MLILSYLVLEELVVIALKNLAELYPVCVSTGIPAREPTESSGAWQTSQYLIQFTGV